MKKLPHILLALTLQSLSFAGFYSYGQSPAGIPDTIQNQESLIIVSDTILPADTLAAAQGDIETTIVYSARDSIRMDVVNRKVYLYGAAKIDYGDISLSAGRIEIDWGKNLMTAMPALDSMGKKTEVPVFKDAEGTYEVDTAQYNFKTRKGISKGVVTQQGEGYIHGEKIKKVDDNLYISRAQYTTCNLEHPHFYINAKKLKVIPQDKIVSGPFNLVISDVPTPLGFFLGFFPVPRKEKSGFIIPTFGSSQRGFFLREGGYYWAVNDYAGVRLVGDAYANGSFRTSFVGEYIKRYGFIGNLSVNYSETKLGFEEDEVPSTDINFQWSHRTQTKKNSSLSANVNAGSSGFYKRNSYNPTTFQQGTFSSTVSYYKTFANTPFTLSLALRQDQNITTRVMNFTLPEATFAMNRVYPFRRKAGVGKPRVYENINLAYTLDTKIMLTNDSLKTGYDTVLAFKGKNLPLLFDKAEYGARHTIPLSTTFKPTKTFLRYFNFTPNLTYTEFWYPYKLDYQWNPTDSSLVRDTLNGFSRTYSYSGGMSLSTTVFGMYSFNSKKLLGIRHTLIPTIGYSFKPDFTKGNFVNVQTDEFGNRQDLSKYAGFIYGAPNQSESSNMTFSLSNSFEAKVASKKDTVTGTRKFKLIDQLLINGFYNFAAKRNNLSPINAVARTRLFNRVDIQTTAVFDPYLYLDSIGTQASNLGRKYTFYSNEFAIKNNAGLAKLTNYNISIGANLNPKAKKVYKSDKGTDQELQQINLHPYMYVDFDMPWTLFVSYNIQYSKRGSLDAFITQSLTFNGDIKLTEKWKIGFNSGYDFVLNTFTTTRIDVYRDLHCWQMSINASPFGSNRFYSFTINAKSSILQDLKLNKKSPTYYGSFY